jgi:MFS family permease
MLPLKLFRSASVSAGVVLVILLMFALFGAMFFMTFFLENVHGLSPIAAGVHLLPMTAMLIVGSPLAGTVISRIGPRLPIVADMTVAAAAMFGLSRLGATASPYDTVIWFVLLGLGLAPVMVGATDVIVGNAPAELAGVAGGLQSTAMQLGGTFGTAVLGAIMSARIDSLLPASWHAAHLPPLTAAQYAQVKGAVSVGLAPVPSGTPAEAAGMITQISHATFTAGMHNAFLAGAAVAIAAGAAGSHSHVHGHTLHGSQQVTTAAGMGIVALGAGAAVCPAFSCALAPKHTGFVPHTGHHCVLPSRLPAIMRCGRGIRANSSKDLLPLTTGDHRNGTAARGDSMPPVDHVSNKGTLNVLLDRAFSGTPAGLPPDRAMFGLFMNFSRRTRRSASTTLPGPRCRPDPVEPARRRPAWAGFCSKRPTAATETEGPGSMAVRPARSCPVDHVP